MTIALDSARFIVCMLAASHCLVADATVSGLVVDGSQKPLAGLTFQYQRLTRGRFRPNPSGRPVYVTPPGQVQVVGTFRTNSDGSFRVQSVPPGEYSVCMDSRNTPHLDPCRWAYPISFNVAPALTEVRLNPIVLRDAVKLAFRVLDPSRLLPDRLDLETRSPVVVGVVAQQIRHIMADQANRDSDGITFQMNVPAGGSVRLWVLSSIFDLADDQGRAISSTGLGSQLGIPATGTITLTFSIRGVKASPGFPGDNQ